MHDVLETGFAHMP